MAQHSETYDPQHQRLEALKRANKVRSQKKDIKARLKKGELSPVTVILTTELPLTVSDVLFATPRLGKVKIARIKRIARVDITKRLIDLTQRQRELLASTVRGNH